MESKDYKYEKVKKKEDEKSENLSVSYFQLYKFSTTIDRLLLGVAVLLGVVCGFTEAFFYVIVGRYVGTIANFGNKLMNSVNETETLEAVEIFQHKTNDFAISNVTISIIVFTTTYISTCLFNYTAMKQIFKIRELYFSQVLNQDISWHDRISTGDFASRFVDDLQKIQDGINDKAALACSNAAIVVTTIVQALVIGWKLALACLVLLPISFVMIHCIGKLSTKLSKEETEANGEAGKVADETLTYIKTVVAFNGQNEEMKRYDKLLLFAMKNNIKRCFFMGLTSGVAYCSAYLGMAVGLWYGVRLIMQGREGDGDVYSIEKIVTVYNSIMVATFYIGGLSPFFSTINSAKGAAAKIFSVIKSQPFINKSYNTRKEINELKGNISFKNVDFSYPGRPEVEILKNFSLEIKSGETVALVGSSGCGKSTIIQLILRFYDANQGQICLDGNEIKDLNLETVRDHIGMVGQEPVLFDGTIAENIKFGRLSATQADIEEAARKSNAHSFITSFPKGYQTVTGERGTQLSGGQKQRIAIARALVRKPAILLLDEATSALDSKSESIVQATLDEVSKDCTTIIVAHRLSTIRQANRIVVLENGSIVEEGSHEELMLLKGTYYNLVVTQLSSEDGDYSKGPENDTTEMAEEQPQENDILPKEVQTKKQVDYKFTTAWKILKENLFPRWCIIVAIICSFGHVISTTSCSLCIGRGLAVMAANDSDYVISQVNLYSGIVVCLGFTLCTSSVCQSYFLGIAGENLTKNLKSSMFKVMISQEMQWFDRSENGVGSLGARLAGEPSSVQNAISLCSATFINLIIAAFALFFVGMYFSWKLLLCSLCFIPLLIILLYLEHKLLMAETRKGMEVIEQSAKLAVEAISNIRTVASLAVEKAFHDLFMVKPKSYKRVIVRNFHIKGVVYGLSRCTFPLSYIITMYYGAYLIRKRETDAATVIALTEIFISFIWYINNCLVNFTNITKGFVACNQIHELINRTPEKRVLLKHQVQAAQTKEDIHYSDLFFSYPTRPDTKILDGFDLSVMKGTKVALVGPSGCGKSTVIQLLERFYAPDSGQITYGDQDIYETNVDSHRLRLGLVMQEPNLFSRTIAENIAYGNLGVKVPHAAIIEASQKANIHNFIISLPLGYDTVLGDKGTQLSGGQKQRIAIARALVRNPEVLLLDEATSALDADSEKIVQEALKQSKEERTCIVIAHRLETVVDSNLIVVLDKGKVAETGTHQELMNLQGLYWNLYNLQQQS